MAPQGMLVFSGNPALCPRLCHCDMFIGDPLDSGFHGREKFNHASGKWARKWGRKSARVIRGLVGSTEARGFEPGKNAALRLAGRAPFICGFVLGHPLFTATQCSIPFGMPPMLAWRSAPCTVHDAWQPAGQETYISPHPLSWPGGLGKYSPYMGSPPPP